MDHNRHHHDNHDAVSLMRLAIDWLQFIALQNERIIEMSETTQQKLDRNDAAIAAMVAAVTLEIQQLKDAVTDALTPAQSSQIDASIAKIEAAVNALGADDPAPTV